jgi:uncharacterized membrane protein
MSNELVLAFFENEAAADEAVKEIKRWDEASVDIRLSAIGIMVKDDKGKIKTHKLGERRSLGGAVLFGLAALLTGGTIIGLGAMGGILAGAGVGALIHKGLKISKEEMQKLNQELDDGKAAVGVMTETGTTEPVHAHLSGLKGYLKSFEVAKEVIDLAQEAARSEADTTQDK